ncbi:ABC transporter substrate-binding protein [Rhizobium sp. TRM95111]|uniref:ABC transporter substrate-binding protein n=1 Tax=Rhizobium alarense TaxID=2846851 RepID=UPI001F27EA68|nr:ABC transporter substrate-binding protein [Rhizobium alarense]MCF3639302.1 ABC transporter substrate-binding protein [Rhizobium alarense]
MTDLAGRTVTVTRPVHRIVLAEARQLVSLSFVDKAVIERVVGVAGIGQFDPEARRAYEALHPSFASVPQLDDGSGNLSAELTIAQEPDLVIMSGHVGPDPRREALMDTFAAAGIATVFIDFRADPYDNTIPSVALLGRVLGTEATASEFVDFYREHRQRVVERVATLSDRPTVLLHMQASGEDRCCTSPSSANLGRFIREAGGTNIGENVVRGAFAQLTPEYVLAQDPDIYIGTGGRHLANSNGIVAGPGISETEALSSLRAIAAMPVLSELSAMHNGRAHGLWHNFTNSPLNIVALEVMATWFHPEAFSDLDPNETVREINTRFLPVPFEGAAWASLPKE